MNVGKVAAKSEQNGNNTLGHALATPALQRVQCGANVADGDWNYATRGGKSIICNRVGYNPQNVNRKILRNVMLRHGFSI